MMRRVMAVVVVALSGCGATRVDGGTGGGSGGPVDAGEAFPIDLREWEGVVSSDDVRFLREMAKASLGEAADLDGDGIAEVTAVRLEDGTTRWDFDVLNDDWPLMTAERLPSGKVTLAFRLNQTSQINAVRIYDGPVSTYEWNDNLRANWFSDRETQTVDVDAGVVAVRHEQRASASAGWAIVDDYSTALAVDQAMPSPSCSWPPPAGVIQSVQSFRPGTDIAFHDGDGYECSEDDKRALLKAFTCAMDKVRQGGCLAKRNAKLAAELLALFTARRATFLFSCNGNTCASSYLAQTDLVLGASGQGAVAPIRFNMEALRNPQRRWTIDTDVEMCTIMLHELLHHVVGPGVPDHDKGLVGDVVRRDKVYACSAYCATECGSKLQTPLAITVPISLAGAVRPGSLCAYCAGTDEEVQGCGYEDRTRDGLTVPCPNLDLCHGAIGVNKTCEVCADNGFVDCRGDDMEARMFRCCVYCPLDADKNDKPCGEYQPRAAPGCDKAPECPNLTP